MGSNIYDDRYVEFINKYQEQRDGLGGDLDAKLHTGPQLNGLLHATQVRTCVWGTYVYSMSWDAYMYIVCSGMRICIAHCTVYRRGMSSWTQTTAACATQFTLRC